MAPVKRRVFKTKNEIAVELAKYIADLSSKFCKERGVFTVVLSGGDLISWLWKLLGAPYIDSVEWSKWHIFWVDERVCAWDHADSNYKLAYDGFLSKVPIPAENIYAIDNGLGAEGNAELAAERYEECLKQKVNQNIIRTYKSSGFPQFDLQLLGMGPDGHMASLFPGHDQINEKVKWVTWITDSPKPPPKRITFTLPVINCASYNVMAVCDQEQADSVAAALNHTKNLPAGRLTADVEVVWFLDHAAASKLPNGWCSIL
ncbi:PREDICTED: probable 6-phosphogluconolactonase 2 [Camelina sativa]|uniref:Probable 6-phosphogluconolactonase n=1 Tax=Camelina sativa TaxID=90675 RepID=A0ABM0THD0_CAMSA|nr:PREDICTED: probable 6-phosphogluconolactonase 2 [Camelina sativa]